MSDIVKRDDCLKVIDRFIGYLDEDMIYRIKLKLKQDVSTIEERPKGQWDEAGYCSNCGMSCYYHVSGTVFVDENANYCPNCGADMMEVENDIF